MLFAVPRAGHDVTLGEVRTFVAERLAAYKVPDCLVVVTDLPVTSIGKIDKLALRPRALEEAARWTN